MAILTLDFVKCLSLVDEPEVSDARYLVTKRHDTNQNTSESNMSTDESDITIDDITAIEERLTKIEKMLQSQSSDTQPPEGVRKGRATMTEGTARKGRATMSNSFVAEAMESVNTNTNTETEG